VLAHGFTSSLIEDLGREGLAAILLGTRRAGRRQIKVV
jgi:hypothetical protein